MEEERHYQPVQQFNPGPEYNPGPNRFTFFAGVIVPAISITVEATTHICADTFFNPIPTIWHLLLVIFVPLAQLQVWFAIRRRAADRLALAGFLNAVTIGISIFYAIVYLPLVPLALLALLFGLGLLPLAPFLSLLASLIMRYQLKRVAAAVPRRSFALKARGLFAGLALTAAIIGMVELPATITTVGLYMASSSSPQTQADGIRFLRKYGNKEALLRSCYDRTGWATDVLGAAFKIKNPITPEEAQKIYYRVTGETFDGSIPPERAGIQLVQRDTVDFDSNQGGEQVGGGMLSGLSLASSKLDGSVDADGGVGYLEWTLIFRNDSDVQREARAEVQLPPGGVVSRLTLWVNGEEREAAFAGRSQVRNAYQKVAIQQRRDPVLVTTAGRDRVLVQCFPVPPNKGEMKIRFGITLPLVLEDETHAKLLLPHFVFKNFKIPKDVKHAVWVEAKTPMWPYSEVFMPSRQQDVFSTAGAIDDDTLSSSSSTITLNRYGSKEMWTKDPFNPGFAVTQSVIEYAPAHLRRIVFVIDTSASMRGYIPGIEAAIRSLPPDFDVKLVLADADGLAGSIALTNLAGQDAEAILQTLQRATLAGGADNTPSLLKGWDLAAQTPGINAIVWIHGPQRLLLTPVDELRRRWEQRRYGPTLYSVQTTGGVDEIEKRLDGINEVRSVARTGLLENDLKILFAQLTGQVKTLQFVRSSKKLDKHQQTFAGVETSDHLARLWASDEVARILAPRDESLTDEATMLAVRYQLVTPVSGAVVLETAEQYRASDLQPVDAGTVPTIPEPEIAALLIVVGAFLIWLMYMKYRKQGRGSCTV
ncbi:MAG TPA: VIT domain-containing protein [Pyrinomonadaceae bacterium]|nr:VIT domain-containing protein [Pyrinomonadaceae bacterium]